MIQQVNYLSSVQFHGTSTSQTENETKLKSDDLFICTYGGKSKSIDYTTLKNQIFNDVFNAVLGVKSMAYQSKTAYSLSSHVHDDFYNKLSVAGQNGNVKLFTIQNQYQSSSSKSTTISANMVYSEKPIEPKPGTVKFVYGNKVPKQFPVDDKFDGWVYADGTKSEFSPYDLKLSNSEFIKLPSYQVLGNGNSSSPKIVIPSLTSFFKVSPGKITSIGIQNYTIGIPNHVHSIDKIDKIKISIEKSDDSYIQTMQVDDSKAYGPHAGDMYKSNTPVDFSFDVSQLRLPEFYSDYTGSSTEEPKPAHCKLLVMVYIGGRTKPYTT